MVATVIGFGCRSPSKALEILHQAVSKTSISTITPIRSQTIGTALTQPPYRTFLDTTSNSNDDVELIIYCLPTCTTEYLQFGSESDTIRTTIRTSPSTVVAVYDPTTDAFLGGTPATIITTLTTPGSNTKCLLASAALTALSNLDISLSHHLISPSNHTIIVVGSGGREHALALSLSKSPLISTILCCPGNGGTALEGGKIRNAGGGGQSIDTVVALVRESHADMVVVGPEQPLVEGLVDVLAVKYPSLKVFGPTQAGVELEASKAFAKDFFVECGIPTASYKSFTDVDEAVTYVERLTYPAQRQVVKASGLAAGKGVLIPITKEDTIQAVRDIMSSKSFGSAGDTCVIESFMTGPEASLFAFCDGKTAVMMPAAQDHKRVGDGDTGLNTGGMGAYCPAEVVTDDVKREVEGWCKKTVEMMRERGTPYVGLLYAGVMLTPTGPSMLEYNCRFGDPETQAILPLLETDLYEIFLACCDGTLAQIDVRIKENTHAATVVCVAGGYPEAYPKGMVIEGIDDADGMENVKVFHAGTGVGEDGVTRTTGGRVLSVTGVGPSLEEALSSSYKGVKEIKFIQDKPSTTALPKLLHHRTDIAKAALTPKLRIGILGSTRGSSLLPILAAINSNHLHAEIVAVLSDKSSAPILDKGRALGPKVTTKFVSSKKLTREEYDAECTSVLVGAGVDYLVLVGYMRILSGGFCRVWKGRVVNVHPSLLPKFAGGMDLAVHQAVIDAGETESGCTIHEVTEEVDAGPILVQKVVKVEPNETAQSLKLKIQQIEGPAYIEAIKKYVFTIQGNSGGTITYADAGVSIDAGNNLVELIKPACKSTRRPGCDSDLGGFGGLFDLSAAGYGSKNTILIGATDGVGTKLCVAQSMKNHGGVGIDLVAMCVNDLIVAGGEPLFFLDYYATGKLEVEEAAEVVEGIAEGCRQANCGLIGGETAEMPSMYAVGDYDLAGFSVGAVEKGRVLPSGVGEGDVLLGLESSGIHSNGFSLVRKLIKKANLTYDSPCPWDTNGDTITLGESLLTPTKIYVRCCMPLLKNSLLNAMSHITGGGLLENLPRSLPKGVVAEITGHPALPSIFKWMQQTSALDDREMLRTFNCGIGMVLIVKADKVDEAKSLLSQAGEVVYDLGKLVNGDGEQVVMKAPL